MSEAGNVAKMGLRSNPCKFVIDGIMACVDSVENDMMLEGSMQIRDPERSEVDFLGWIVQSFKKRDSWPVGEWISTVTEESLVKAMEAYRSAI